MKCLDIHIFDHACTRFNHITHHITIHYIEMLLMIKQCKEQVRKTD